MTPHWLGVHALLLASLAALGSIGWWQLDKALGAGNWQNYGYAVQWWLFGAFAVFLWVKLILDDLDPSRVQERLAEHARPAATLPLALPQRDVAPVDDEDLELAAYNRHLAELAQRSER